MTRHQTLSATLFAAAMFVWLIWVPLAIASSLT